MEGENTKINIPVNTPDSAPKDVPADATAETNNNGETERRISEVLAKKLGGSANLATELEGGVKTNIIITETDRTDVSNAINDAAQEKIQNTKWSRIITRVPIIGTIAKAGIAAIYRSEAAAAVRDAGGDTAAIFEALGIEGKSNSESRDYTKMRARLALESSGFEDQVSADNNMALNEGEKVERVKDERQDAVNAALKNLFSELSTAKAQKDDEAYKLAKEKYLEQVSEWQKQGTFGENQQTTGSKILENKIVTFLIGEHSKKSITELDGLKKMADGVEDLVKEKIAQEDFDKYIDKNVSLYNANMKGDIYTKQAVDSLTAAVAVGGLAGALTYSVLGFGRASVKGDVKADVKGATGLSNVAVGFGVGAAFGAAFGAVRGVNKARVAISEAERKAATSADELLTAEERAAQEQNTNADADANENVDKNESGENKSQKPSFKSILQKINSVKKAVTGENKYTEIIEELRDRKSAKELYEKLEDGNSADELIDALAEIKARNQVSSKEKIDLISYSKGNVSKERALLAEKMIEAEKLVSDKEKLTQKIDERVNELIGKSETAKDKKARFIVRAAMVNAIVGGAMGGASGVVFGKIRDLKAASGLINADNAEVAGEQVANTENAENNLSNITFEDKDGDGILAVYDKEGNAIISEETGLHFDEQTGQIDESDLKLLRDAGVDIQEKEIKVETLEGGQVRRVLDTYFSKNGENYVENVKVDSEDIDPGNTVTSISRNSWIAMEDGNRAADIVVDPTPINDGDIILNVTARDEAIDVDNLQVVLTPSREIGDVGIVLDVADDGTVTIPAGSAAASMFADGTGSFAGGTMEVVQAATNGDGYDVLSTGFGANNLESVSFQSAIDKTTYVYEIDGNEVVIPDVARVGVDLETVGAESMRDSGPVEYTQSTEEVRVNGLSSGDTEEVVTAPHRTGNYSEADDPFFSAKKERPALNSQNLVREIVDPNYEMTNEEANETLLQALSEGEIRTDEVVDVYLEQVGNSPEQIVEMRAMLGDFNFDIDGDGVDELIDTDYEINAVADILKNSAEPEGYSAFVNDTFDLLYEKMNGGEVRLINYAEEPYDYTTLGYLDKLNNVIHQFARYKKPCSGVGIEFLDKDGNSVYDLDVARKVWKMPSNATIAHVTERLNCGQKTADVDWTEAATAARIETTTVPQEPASASAPTTPTTPTTPVTTVPVTSAPEPVTPEPEPVAPTTPEPAPLAGKTATNPWAGDNPSVQPVTPSFEEESAANGEAPIIQAGQENIPEVDTSGVNMNPAEQQDWAEASTEPVQDTGTGGLVDQSAASDAEAAAALAQTEAALAAQRAAEAAAAEAAGGGS